MGNDGSGARNDPRFSYNNKKIGYNNLRRNFNTSPRPWNKVENHNSPYLHEMKLEDLLTEKFKPCGSNCLMKNTPYGQVWYEKQKKLFGYAYIRIK